MDLAATKLLEYIGSLGDTCDFAAPAPTANWWAHADEVGSDGPSAWVVEIDAKTEFPARLVLALERAGMIAADALPDDERDLMPGGDDLDVATHVYTITPAGRAYLAAQKTTGASNADPA